MTSKKGSSAQEACSHKEKDSWLFGKRLCLILPSFAVISIFVIEIYNQFYKKRDNGSILWPYISIAGGKGSEYYMFTSSMTIASFGMVVLVLLWSKLMKKLGYFCKKVKIAALLGGFCAPICLLLLAYFDIFDYGWWHYGFAFGFFSFALLFQFTHCRIMFKLISKIDIVEKEIVARLRKMHKVRLSLVLISVIFILIYGPGTTPFSCNPDYDPESKTKDYSECKTVHSIKAIFQLLSVFSLLIYFSVLKYDFVMYGSCDKCVSEIKTDVKSPQKNTECPPLTNLQMIEMV
eukprot:TRINITY_DN779918_c0_g1_i1.p1 TRINITY_DN779918_c0_g1~~TRINITY_DN779918_c0_g1_i1.p1  ORF type:complete len:291 (+),score=36.08 TRINITY_DN779918_c0_g1_i1:86-958(+)